MSLREELRNNPACADAIAARDLDEIARIASIGRTRFKMAEIADVQAVLHRTGEWWQVKACAANAGHPATQAAIAVCDVADARYQNIDLSSPLVVQSFGALVATGVMTQPTLDEIDALGFEPDPITRDQVDAVLFNDDGTDE